jgi:pimeloyl-ACP methyl ester carboxylesterase
LHSISRVFSIVSAIAAMCFTASGSNGQDCGPTWQPPFEVDPQLYPFEPNCIDLGHGIIHYIDEGPSTNPKATVLLLHGNPAWSFLYRDIAFDLATDGYRVVAPDMYGFGFSDKPDPMTFSYSGRAQSEIIAELIETLDLRDTIIVLHDWGGPIGFAAAGTMPARFKGVVITNTWAWDFTPAMQPYFHDVLNWGAAQVRYTPYLLQSGWMPFTVGKSVGRVHGPPGSPDYLAVRNAYWAPFLDLDTGQPLSTDHMLPTNRWYHYLNLDPEFIQEAEAGMNALSHLPVYLVFGAGDSLFGALRCDETSTNPCPPGTTCAIVQGVELCVRTTTQRPVFPTIREFKRRWDPSMIVGTTISPDAGHFVQEWEPKAVADAVRAVNH